MSANLQTKPQARNGREAKAYNESLESIQARITAARHRAREKRLELYQASKRVTVDGLSAMEAGLLELDARRGLKLKDHQKAALLGVARTSTCRARARIPDWDERVANRSAEILQELVPEADEDLGNRLRDFDPDVRRQAADQLYKMVGRLGKDGVNIVMSQTQGQSAPALPAELLTAALGSLLQSLPESDKLQIVQQLTGALSHNSVYVNQKELPEAVVITEDSPQRDERGRYASPAVAVCTGLASDQETGSSTPVVVEEAVQEAPEPPEPVVEPVRVLGSIERMRARAEARPGYHQDMRAAHAARRAKRASHQAGPAETKGGILPHTPPCDEPDNAQSLSSPFGTPRTREV